MEEGPAAFVDWFDDRVWYPLGRTVSATMYPGMLPALNAWPHLTSPTTLLLTAAGLVASAATVIKGLRLLGLPADVMTVCAFMAPAFASLTALATYFFVVEIKVPARPGLQ